MKKKSKILVFATAILTFSTLMATFGPRHCRHNNQNCNKMEHANHHSLPPQS